MSLPEVPDQRNEFWLTLTYPQAVEVVAILRRERILPEGFDKLGQVDVRIVYYTEAKHG